MPKGSHVLMADDDKMLIDMYKERLELAGYVVILCRNGEETLAKIREAKPDIILLDIMMPKINGYEALASIKSDPATKDIPVIMLSALMRDFNREKAVEAGADDYLIKSEAMPADVITKVEQVLAKYGKTASPTVGNIPPNIPAPSATPVGQTPPADSSQPLPDLPPKFKVPPVSEAKMPKAKKPLPEEAPFVAPTPDAAVMQPDAPRPPAQDAAAPTADKSDKVIFTPAETEEVPMVKISPPVVPESPVTLATPMPNSPMEKEPIIQPTTKADKPNQSLASIALVVAMAMLLTTLINDIAIYFFFFAKK